MVLHEEHHQPKCSSRPPSRKSNATRIPQRGLGVAQLEKIRIGEMQKTSSNTNSPGGSPSPSDQPSLPFLPPMAPTEPIPPIRSAIISSIRLINSKATFVPSSSGVNIQAEPPSNQNYNANTPRREEERNLVTNLPWPFHPETAASFSGQLLKPEEPMPICGKAPLRFEYKSTVFSKEVASSSTSYQIGRSNSEVHINKRLKENAGNGFLTLGSPVTQSPSKLKQPTVGFPVLQSLGSIEDAAEQDASSSEKAFYSFLPMRRDATK